MNTEAFIAAYREDDITQTALRTRQFPDVDAAFALQQIEGWQKARLKLPSIAAIPGWIWPRRLSVEQSSSEECAALKQRILSDSFRAGAKLTGADLTGGMGIDSFFLSRLTEEWTYVEMQEELCRIAEHNFRLADKPIRVVNTTAEAYLEQMEPADLLFIDPARRDNHGGKVFRLQDCTPDAAALYPLLMRKTRTLALKLSPMLDLHEALRSLPDAEEAYVLALRGEVKELFIVCRKSADSPAEEEATSRQPRITAINITPQGEESFCFTEKDEQAAQPAFCKADETQEGYLYEPNAAILKAGAFKLIATRFGLRKLAPNTHLYHSPKLTEGFPGRTFRIVGTVDKQHQKSLSGQAYNILTRNHPLRPEEIRKKLKTKDGGERFIIGARTGEKAMLFIAERISQTK